MAARAMVLDVWTGLGGLGVELVVLGAMLYATPHRLQPERRRRDRRA